jgi:hypothetical protein
MIVCFQAHACEWPTPDSDRVRTGRTALDPTSTRDPHAGRPVADSVSALLANIIDYAGLFPPASLDMPTIVANYASYLASDDAWLLERLIVPAARLDEFEACAADHLPQSDDADPWPISALTVPASDERLAADLARITTFNEAHRRPDQGLALIDVIEFKAVSVDFIDEVLDAIPDDLYPFFELPSADDPRGLIAALVGGEAGAKIRTGGVMADLYPTPAQVARFIAACAASDVPFKATAGLHHPLRQHSDAVGAEEFGFLNVFIAAALALNANLPESDLIPVLEEGSISAFSFNDDGLTWRDHRITVQELEDTRLAQAISFGSCSFDEPRAGLRALGLL